MGRRASGNGFPRILTLWACFAVAVPGADRSGRRVLQVPHGTLTELASPDGRFVLFGLPFQAGVRDGPELWIRETKTGERHLLVSLGSTAHAEWAPDGSAFYVADHQSSDRALTWVYDASGRGRLDVSDILLKADPELLPFTNAHVYVNALKWLNSQTLLVSYSGHTDEPPVRCFLFRYTVWRDGAVKRLYRRVAPVNEFSNCPG